MVLFVDVRLSLFVFTRLRQLCAFEISALRHHPGLPTPYACQFRDWALLLRELCILESCSMVMFGHFFVCLLKL